MVTFEQSLEDLWYRFNALRELIPHKDKMDKATFLQQAVDYIRQLQVLLSDCMFTAYELPICTTMHLSAFTGFVAACCPHPRIATQDSSGQSDPS